MNENTLIDQASRVLTPLKKNIDSAGPGGQSYDLAPTPRLAEPSAATSPTSHDKFLLATVFLVGLAIGFSLGHDSSR